MIRNLRFSLHFLKSYGIRLQIVSKLTDWACMGRIRLTDYETDSRFVKVCRLLGQSGKGDLLGDLSVVLNVTADEQAAKLVSSISVPQMIRVILHF